MAAKMAIAINSPSHTAGNDFPNPVNNIETKQLPNTMTASDEKFRRHVDGALRSCFGSAATAGG